MYMNVQVHVHGVYVYNYTPKSTCTRCIYVYNYYTPLEKKIYICGDTESHSGQYGCPACTCIGWMVVYVASNPVMYMYWMDGCIP